MKRAPLVLIAMLCTHLISAQNIYRTACQGNLKRLDSLLQHHSINTVDQNGRSLLHWAVACGKSEVVTLLLDKNIAITTVDKAGIPPIYMAVRFQHLDLFNRLVELQPNISWKTTYGGLLYEKAIINKDLDFVQRFIDMGIPVDLRSSKNSTPLEVAKRLGAEEIATLLLNNGADPDVIKKVSAVGPYMGQAPPGTVAKIFAPRFISTEEYEFGSVFNAAGTEFYYGVDLGGHNVIRYSKLKGTSWTKPVTLLQHETYGYNDPFLSPDEQRLYFISDQALDGQGASKDIDIWYVQREGDHWSNPINAGPNINSEGEEYYISFTENGRMYFASDVNQSHHDIYYSDYNNGQFQQAVKLGSAINTDAYEADVFVAPDESYLIFCAQRPEGMGRGDLYISFKEDNGTWSTAVNMGEAVNTFEHELCPFVTADGRYLFYTSNQDIYWISTAIFEGLRPTTN